MLAEATQSKSSLNNVLAALHQASAATGENFQYLLGTAMRESGLKPQAKSSTSSAAGLFQFVDQTWLGLIKQQGAKYGLASYANQIVRSADGHYAVANQSDRQAILALRNDPRISALMEGEYANQARASLECSLGREVCDGELYAAHFLGPEAAGRLIRMKQSQPNASATAAFPQAAAANRSVFYHADGTSKSVREVYEWAAGQSAVASSATPASAVAKSPARVAPQTAPENPPSSDQWTALQLLSAAEDGSPLLSLGGLPQSSFVVSPGIIDVLGALSPANSNSHSHLRTSA